MSGEGPTRVGIVADRAVHGALWSRVLGAEPGIEVVAAAIDVAALLAAVQAGTTAVAGRVDVVLVDLATSTDAARASTALQQAIPDVAVAVVEAGVPLDALVDRVRAAGGSITMLSGSTLQTARGQIRSVTPRSPAAAYPRLTEREREVLECLSRGNSAAAIAAELRMSVHTCRGHLRTLMAKLGARSQLEVLAFVAEHGLPDTAAPS